MKITNKIKDEIRKFAYEQSEKYQLPPVYYLELSVKKGQILAKRMKADKNVVLLGTLLMDCQLGLALKKNKQAKHVEMSEKKTEELLNRFPNLDDDQKVNVLACVREHHGVKKYYSIESEICCNADCYRFASVSGFLGGLRYTRDMPLDDLVDLLSTKADEKWNALSLGVCKKELRPQYELIEKVIKEYKTR